MVQGTLPPIFVHISTVFAFDSCAVFFFSVENRFIFVLIDAAIYHFFITSSPFTLKLRCVSFKDVKRPCLAMNNIKTVQKIHPEYKTHQGRRT